MVVACRALAGCAFALVAVAEAQSFERPSWRVGDTWEFHVVTAPPETKSTWRGVAFLNDNRAGYRLVATGPDASIDVTPELNVQGAPRRRGPFPNFDFPLFAGHAWKREYKVAGGTTAGSETADWAVRAVERVSVPAGSFDCMRVEGELFRSWTNAIQMNQMFNKGQVNITYWYCPEVKWFAKMVVRAQESTAATVTTATWELERFRPGP